MSCHAPGTTKAVLIPASELLHVLANALIFAAPASGQHLGAVTLTVRGGYLVGQATDRSILGEFRGRLSDAGSDPEFKVFIPAAEVKGMLPGLRAWAKSRTGFSEVQLHTAGGRLEWLLPGSSGAADLYDGGCPNLDAIMSRAVAGILDGSQPDPETQWAIDPVHLAMVSKVRDLTQKGARQLGHLTLVPQSSPRRPLLWQMGKNARGLIMPISLTNPKTVRDLIGAWGV